MTGVVPAMIHVLSLLSMMMLAGCTLTITASEPTPQPIIADEISLSFHDMPDVPAWVEELFDTTFDNRAWVRGIPFEPGHLGTIGIYGYLSVVAGGAGTLIIYVFEFEDDFGRRLLRVGGQVTSFAVPADPWDAVGFALAVRIVDDVLDQFEDWLAENSVGV